MKMKAIAVFASAALVVPMAATAQDEAPAFDLSVSGHIARIVQHVSGPGSESRATPAGTSFQHKDAGVSGSRFRVTGSEELGNGLTAGVNLEYAAIAPSLRHAAVSLGGNFGSLNMGHTAPATNGSNDDLSASSLAVDMACSDAAMASCPDFTTGRQGVIRYNTPGGGPVGGAFGFGSGLWDAQLSTSGEMAGGASYALRVSYADVGSKNKASRDAALATARTNFVANRTRAWMTDNNGLPLTATDKQLADAEAARREGLTEEQEAGEARRLANAQAAWTGWSDERMAAYRYPGSSTPVPYMVPAATGSSTFSVAAAMKFQSLSVSTLWGKISPDSGVDTKGYGIKLGYDFGNNGVGLLYRSTDTGGAADPKTWGFGVQHNMGMAEFFSGYYIHDPDTAGSEKTNTFNVGTRVKFN